jgi:hypothetical protein
MKRILITLLALVGLTVLVRQLPRVRKLGFLHGTGTVVRDQKAWIAREAGK